MRLAVKLKEAIFNLISNSREAIFANLYDYCAANPFSKAAYLESLEPFILNDQLRAIPPTIVKEFITHYEEIENYKVRMGTGIRIYLPI